MQQEFTNLLRAVPFKPFVIFTRDGEPQAVTNVERLSAGRNVCAYVDEQGDISLIPYTAIDRVSTTKNGLDRIAKMLGATPFVAFKLKCGKTEFIIESPTDARFDRFGNVEVHNQGDGMMHTLFSEHITLVEAADISSLTKND